jgi:hypothetical protein
VDAGTNGNSKTTGQGTLITEFARPDIGTNQGQDQCAAMLEET